MTSALLWMIACNGCRPQLPDEPDNDSRTDTADSADTAETAETADTVDTVDTSPPAMCDLEEVEPNTYVNRMELPLGIYACGIFDAAEDQDWLTFTTTEDGWVMVDAQAQSRGSNANLELDIFAKDADGTVNATSSYLSADVKLLFPNDPDTYDLALYEETDLYGEDYTWFLIASPAKPPVVWDDNEIEPNDSTLAATPFSMGVTLFGRIDAPGDYDYYVLDVAEGTDTVTFEMAAKKYGSAANNTITLYKEDGTKVWDDAGGEGDYDPDPWREWKLPDAGRYHLRVYNSNENMGSMFHWYTLSISATMLETDTGA